MEVEEETEFRASYVIVLSSSDFDALQTQSVQIKCYRNRKDDAPIWIDVDEGVYFNLRFLGRILISTN